MSLATCVDCPLLYVVENTLLYVAGSYNYFILSSCESS